MQMRMVALKFIASNEYERAKNVRQNERTEGYHRWRSVGYASERGRAAFWIKAAIIFLPGTIKPPNTHSLSINHSRKILKARTVLQYLTALLRFHDETNLLPAHHFLDHGQRHC